MAIRIPGAPVALLPRLVLALHQEIQQRISVDDCFTEVGHHANQIGVPLVGNLGECP